MNASNEICTELEPTYTNFEKLNEDSFTGYKLVQKSNGNYYSIVTGLFRYKVKMVSQNSYHSLYQDYDRPSFNKDLINKVAIFKSIDDAHRSLINYVNDHEKDLVILEIELKGDLIIGEYNNQFCNDAIVVAGTIMEKIKEVKY